MMYGAQWRRGRMGWITSYDDAHRYLQWGRYGSRQNPKLSPDRPLQNATRLQIWEAADRGPLPASAQPDIAVVHYSTAIVIFHPDDTVTLNTDGYVSNSTNERINAYAQRFLPARLFRMNNALWFAHKVGETQRKVIKCPECHYWADEDHKIIVGLEGGGCDRCDRIGRCHRCQDSGRTEIGGRTLYQSWDGGPTRFRHGGEEA